MKHSVCTIPEQGFFDCARDVYMFIRPCLMTFSVYTMTFSVYTMTFSVYTMTFSVYTMTFSVFAMMFICLYAHNGKGSICNNYVALPTSM